MSTTRENKIEMFAIRNSKIDESKINDQDSRAVVQSNTIQAKDRFLTTLMKQHSLTNHRVMIFSNY